MTKGQLAFNNRLTNQQRRQSQICKTFQVKIDKSQLSQFKLYYLKMLFLEAKWLTNYVLSQPDIFGFDTKIREVQVKVGDNFETRQLNYLSSQMKQDIVHRIQKSIVALSKLKKNGKKVGALKFKQRVFSIPLRKYKQTFFITSNKTIRLQGMKKPLKVIGLKQIPNNAEITNAVLINRHGDYFINITCFVPKEDCKINKAIGIDFGIKTPLTLSNGIQINYAIPIFSNIKRIQKRMARQKKHSKNWEKSKIKLEKAFAYLSNIKKDIKNKIVHKLKEEYKYVFFQDDCLKKWQKRWGKKILETSIGGLMSMLKTRIHTPVEVDRFFPSTQICYKCKNKQFMQLEDRIFVCSMCGWTANRDYNASLNIKEEGLKKLSPVERREVPVETGANTLNILEYFNRIPYVKASLVCEAGSL